MILSVTSVQVTFMLISGSNDHVTDKQADMQTKSSTQANHEAKHTNT